VPEPDNDVEALFMRFFSFEGKYPSVLREDGTAFIWNSSKGAWGEMSARALVSDTRTDELTASEFETDLVVAGIDPSTLSAISENSEPIFPKRPKS
jgi:hypothetical protein